MNKKTHCKRGHDLSVTRGAQGKCLECHRIRNLVAQYIEWHQRQLKVVG